VSVESVECLIVDQAIAPERLREARKSLKLLLLEEMPSIQDGATLAEIIASLAEHNVPRPAAAAYLLRFLAVSNLVPESNSANQISRNMVTICEKSLPDLCSYLRVGEKKQSFESSICCIRRIVAFVKFCRR
jgi:hypothetical protein